MKYKTRISHLALFIFSLSATSAHAAESSPGHEMLSVAKMAGACGILDSIIQFQKTTNMPGGDEFAARFWAVEAARLGWTVEELSLKCNQSVELYGKYWTAFAKTSLDNQTPPE